MEAAFKLDDSNKAQIKSAISQQLATILGSQDEDEDVLPEYVCVMIANQKTKEQVRRDLEAFLGEQSLTFTIWLWDMLGAFSAAANAAIAKKEAAPVITSVVTQPKQQEKTTRTSDNDRHNRGDRKSDNNRDDRQQHRRESPPKSVFASVITVPPQPKRQDVENPAPSRLVLNAVSDAVKSISPVPQRPNQNNDRGMVIDDDIRDRKYRTPRRTGGGSSSGSVFSRLGDTHINGANVGDRLNERVHDRANERVHDRLNERVHERVHERAHERGGDRNDRMHTGREDPVTFTITLKGAPEQPLHTTHKRRSMEGQNDKVSEDIEMAEEVAEEGGSDGGEDIEKKKIKKQKCQFWPNCKRGDSCIYVHPSTQCNLFPNCTYGENCLYIHPAIPCKFGAACTRTGCVFNHPTGGAAVATQKGGGGVPCKHGFACPREGCTFAHPPEPCRYGEGCTRPNCYYGHGKACRFGVTCATPGCSFTHYKDLSTRCKFGANCTNISCKFQHGPPSITTKEDDDMVEATISGISASLPLTPPREAVVV